MNSWKKILTGFCFALTMFPPISASAPLQKHWEANKTNPTSQIYYYAAELCETSNKISHQALHPNSALQL